MPIYKTEKVYPPAACFDLVKIPQPAKNSNIDLYVLAMKLIEEARKHNQVAKQCLLDWSG